MQKKTHSGTTFNIAFCGIISALSVMVMFISLVPSFAYAMPAVAGIFIWVISEQIGKKWAFLSYVAVALLSFMLIPEIEADFFFLSFFGYYPTLRFCLDKIKNKIVRFLVKLGIFNAAIIVTYQILCVILSAEEMLEGLEDFGAYAIYILWGTGNIAFLLYDFFLGYMREIYVKFIKPRVAKIINRNM